MTALYVVDGPITPAQELDEAIAAATEALEHTVGSRRYRIARALLHLQLANHQAERHNLGRTSR